jgi:hypothetical protein
MREMQTGHSPMLFLGLVKKGTINYFFLPDRNILAGY